MIGLQVPTGPLAVLALGAHPDDVEIGCGGTLLTLATTRQVRAHVVVLTGTPQRAAEATDAAHRFLEGAEVAVLTHGLPDGRLPAHWDEVKTILEEHAVDIRPDLVLAPRPGDAHQDHHLLATLVTTVWRDCLVLGYEVPKWDGDLRPVSHYVPIAEEVATRKVGLLTECFPSQVIRDWWDGDVFLGLMRLRGVECRRRYAEGFVASKAVIEV